jgi:hypothetical protein
MRADDKGIAWMVAPGAGDYRLVYAGGARPIYVREQTLPDKPGYDYVERVALPVK